MLALRLSDFSINSLEIEIDFPRAVWNNSVAEWDAGMEGSVMSNSLIKLSERADWEEVLETERILNQRFISLCVFHLVLLGVYTSVFPVA